MKNIVYILLLVVPVLIFSGATFAAEGGHEGIHAPIGPQVDPAISIKNALDIAHDNNGYHPHGDDHGKKSGLPQMDPTWFASQLFWLIVMFSFLYAVFAKSVLPALSSTLDGRRDQIENDLETARRLKDEAESIHKEYETAINKARDTATLSYINAEQDIKTTAEERLAKVSQTSAQTIQEADVNIQTAKERALDDVFDATSDMVVRAAEKLTGVKADPKMARAVIDGLVETSMKKAA